MPVGKPQSSGGRRIGAWDRWPDFSRPRSATIGFMGYSIFPAAIWLCLALQAFGQAQQAPGQNQPPPRSERDREAGESSSRDTRIDLSPPRSDDKDHPNSTLPEAEAADESSGDVQEFHPYDPHRALKDIEVGDFYFRKKNYRAALDRYREALFYKPHDALANFRMAQSFEKLHQSDEAADHYQEYLNVLPNGPLSEEAKKALERLKATPSSGKDQARQ
jgi:tetratricopeptide (TPR) repeat protein